jgi:hypothetical protein
VFVAVRSAVKWAVNPFLWASNASLTVASVLSVSVAGVDVTNATVPLVVTMPVGASTPLFDFRCSYWDGTVGNWSDSGTAVIGFTSDARGQVTALCATLHLTDFSAVQKQTGTRVAPGPRSNSPFVDFKARTAVPACLGVTDLCFAFGVLVCPGAVRLRSRVSNRPCWRRGVAAEAVRPRKRRCHRE